LRVIRAQGLAKRYGEIVALESVDLHVKEHEVFGILGSNGAGKSTLLKLLAGLARPTSGTASIGGHDIVSDALAAKRIAGFLPEFPTLPEKLTGWELMELLAQLRELGPDEAHRRVTRMARRLDLRELDRLIGTYSKGMRQKLSLIASMFHRPEVLLMDEPTSGLDPRFSRVVRDMIAETRESATLLIATHSSRLAEQLCDRVAILDEGRVVAAGTIASLQAATRAADLEEVFIRVVGVLEANGGASPPPSDGRGAGWRG
jgi:ABC-2 type transport system ATP-binding protein